MLRLPSNKPPYMTRQLLYDELNSEHMRSFSMALIWSGTELTLYSHKELDLSEGGCLACPSKDVMEKCPCRKVSHEDALHLEELLLTIRLPLSVPAVTYLDGISFRMHLQEGNQSLYLEWGGGPAPYIWEPLDELTAYLRELRARYAKRG